MIQTQTTNPWVEKMGKEWGTRLLPALNSEAFAQLGKFVSGERKVKAVFPAPSYVFNAYYSCPYEDVKVVIFGQEPSTDGFSNGLAYSSINEICYSPMLEKILDAVDLDIYENKNFPPSVAYPNLVRWCRQGVFLPNLVFSSEKGKVGAHLGKGWETLVETTVKELNKKTHLVWMLWGKPVQNTIKPLLNNPNHLILEDSYPGNALPFSGRFQECSQYVQTHFNYTLNW